MKIRITKEQENELLGILIEADKNPSPQNEKIAEEAYLKLFELMHPLIYAVSKVYLKKVE